MTLLASLNSLSGWLVTQGLLGALAFILLFVLWGLLLPKGPMVAFAGYTYGLQNGLAISYLGATLAIMLGFFIARYWGRRHAKRWLSTRPRLAAYEQAIAADAGKIVALMRLSPVVPFQIQNYLYGLSNMRMRTCIVASWFGMLPAMLAPLLLGSSFNDGGGHWWMAVIGLAATVTAATVIARRARRHLPQP